MRAEELIGSWARRKKCVIFRGKEGDIFPDYKDKDYSWTKDPIFILKVTNYHIVFEAENEKGELIEGFMKNKKLILSTPFLDNNWTADVLKNKEKNNNWVLNYVGNKKVEMKNVKPGELLGHWAIMTKSCLGDYSYTERPIFITKIIGKKLFYLSNLGNSFLVGEEWLDDSWVDYEDLVNIEKTTEPGNIEFPLRASLLKRIEVSIDNWWFLLKKRMELRP